MFNLPEVGAIDLGDGIFYTLMEYMLYAIYAVLYILTAYLVAAIP